MAFNCRWLDPKGIAICVALAGLHAGCAEKLETGYQPTRLDMSLAQKKGMYAEPFTLQQQEAQQEDKNDLGARRPQRQP